VCCVSAVNSNIDQLNLSGNCIRQKGAVAICKGLQVVTIITDYNIIIIIIIMLSTVGGTPVFAR